MTWASQPPLPASGPYSRSVAARQGCDDFRKKVGPARSWDDNTARALVYHARGSAGDFSTADSHRSVAAPRFIQAQLAFGGEFFAPRSVFATFRPSKAFYRRISRFSRMYVALSTESPCAKVHCLLYPNCNHHVAHCLNCLRYAGWTHHGMLQACTVHESIVGLLPLSCVRAPKFEVA